MVRTRLLKPLLLISLLSGCGGSGGDSVADQPDQGTSGSENEFSNYALIAPLEKVQPMTGIVFWAENDTALITLGDAVQLEFSYMLYSDLVPSEGNYDWNVLEVLLDEIAARGHQAIVRFRYSYPGQTEVSVPAYIANNPEYRLTTALVENQNTFLPDWSFAGLETFTQAFYIDFAARYDGDPRIAMLQIGFGSYAEYHLFDGPLSLGNNFPSKDFQQSFLETLDSNFITTQWSVSIDAANDDYSPFASVPGLSILEFGLFDDSFMHENHSENDNEYNRSSWLFFGENRYQTSMMGGEFSYYSTYDQASVLNLPNGPWGVSFESSAAQYHLSYIIGNDQLSYQTAARIEEASMSMGYKFNVDSFEISPSQVRFSITNTGIAPIYYDAYPSVDGTRASTSLKGLQPGSTLEYLMDVASNSPAFAIESDHLVDGQSIGFTTD